jgi:hypothetical protein
MNMDPQELFCEIGRYLDTKTQGRFGFALVVIDCETQIVSLIHVGLQQEQAAHLCELVAENTDTQGSTQILPKGQMM